MEEIQHHFVQVRGLNLHLAQLGTGSTVVILLHGFPEIWYSWRHQILALSAAGYRAIAPDFRGYGLSDQPPDLKTASFMDLVHDLLGIVNHLGVPKVFLIAKDFGAKPAYLFALLHPDRVLGIVTVGAPYMLPASSTYLKHLPEGFYISRWQEPGRAEADFAKLDAKMVVRNIYILFSRSEIPIAKEDEQIMDLVSPSTPVPAWLSEEDLATYGALYEKSGFQAALKVPYRSQNEEFNIRDLILSVPTLLIMGRKDYTLKFPGMQEYIESGKVNEYVPDLEIVFLPEGSHFSQEQFPDQVNELILTFLRKHTPSAES